MRTRSQQDPGKLKEKLLTEKVKDLEQLLQDVLQERDQEVMDLRKFNVQQKTQILELKKENADLKLLVGRKVETKTFSSQTDESDTPSYSSAGSGVSQAGFQFFKNQFSVPDLDLILKTRISWIMLLLMNLPSILNKILRPKKLAWILEMSVKHEREDE